MAIRFQGHKVDKVDKIQGSIFNPIFFAVGKTWWKTTSFQFSNQQTDRDYQIP